VATLTCLKCREPIDVTDCKPGAKVYCAACNTPVLVPVPLVDARAAQDAITRARGRSKTATTISCPNCSASLKLRADQGAAGSSFRCTDCGQKIFMASRPSSDGSDTVAFPTLGNDGTLLDMGDTEGWEKK